MPNHVRTKLMVKGPFSKEFKDDFTNEKRELTLEKLMPTPSAFYENDWQNDREKYKHFEPRWYKWNCHHRGTKWDIYNTEILDESENIFMFGFDSAWDCPRQFFLTVSKYYPETVFLFKLSGEIDEPEAFKILEGQVVSHA